MLNNRETNHFEKLPQGSTERHKDWWVPLEQGYTGKIAGVWVLKERKGER